MPRPPARHQKIRSGSAKELSVLAWIQDAYGNVLLVRQTAGKQLWSLPGGKVRSQEPLKQALRRELKEEIGLAVVAARIIDVFDRPAKAAVAILYQATLRKGPLKLRDKEIMEVAFVAKLPAQATPSVRYFWRRHFPQATVRGGAPLSE